jgi:hypothetical protein
MLLGSILLGTLCVLVTGTMVAVVYQYLKQKDIIPPSSVVRKLTREALRDSFRQN